MVLLQSSIKGDLTPQNVELMIKNNLTNFTSFFCHNSFYTKKQLPNATPI